MSDAEGDGPDGQAPRARWTAGSRLAGLAAAGLPVAALDGGSGLGLLATGAFDAVLLVGAAVEARGLARAAPTATRHTEPRLVVGIDNTVRIRLDNPTDRTLRVAIRDDVPAGMEADPPELAVELPPRARREVSYTVRPTRRGRFDFGDIALRVEGSARLGAALVTCPAAAPAKVYPNILGPRRYELAARLGDLRFVGVRNIRRAGGGGELEHLREYVPGDPYRQIDWKASAKRQRPVTRVYQQERSQQVLLCIDAGRLMATRLGELSKLDHAIDAALLLAYVALRNGDRVGLVVFADQVQSFVAPGRGPAHYRRILDTLYAVEARPAAVDFRRLVEAVSLRVPRRALLVLFSDLLDSVHARPLAEHAALLRRKHLPVCVTMNDPVAERIAEAPAERARDVYRRAAAADVLAEREAIKAHLDKLAVGLVEAPAGELAIATVNRYLEIKAKSAL